MKPTIYIQGAIKPMKKKVNMLGFTLIELLVVIAAPPVVVALLASAVQNIR